MKTNRTPHTAVLMLAVCFAAIFGATGRPGALLAATDDPHAYFNALLKRGDLWKSASFRDPAQLGGNKWVTYDPASDADRHRQDAAKVVVPAFIPTAQLAQPTTADATTLTLVTAYKPLYPPTRVIRIDNEVMAVTAWLNETQITVNRGQFGTARAAHSSGAAISHTTNSLPQVARVNLGTQDGHDYTFVWDAYWTDSYVGVGQLNHKLFQFASGGSSGEMIWLQPQVSYTPNSGRCWNQNLHVASFSVRSLQKTGGNALWSLSDGDSLGPSAKVSAPLNLSSEFCIEPNTWVRFYLRMRQKANDYDPVDMWIADERHDPVQVVLDAPVSVRTNGPAPNSVTRFWVEFNSSTDLYLRVDNRDLISYVRNFAALVDVRDFENLLVRPVPGAAPLTGPLPPTNVRIVR